MKAIKRREIIKDKAGDAFRFLLDENDVKINDSRTSKRINAIMDICKISRTGDESELTRNIKIIMRNVSAEVVPGDNPFEAEKGGRVYNAVRALRMCVSSSDALLDENCREICDSGVLQRLVVLLNNEASDKYPKLELEAAWVCTNIASGVSEFCVKLVMAGVVPCMVHLLNTSDAEVQDQALWALANLAGDSSFCRNAVVQAGVVSAIAKAFHSGIEDNMKAMRDLAFLCRNIMNTKPLPHINETKDLIPLLSAFLHKVAARPKNQSSGEVEDIVISCLHAFLGFTSQDEKGELSMDIMIETRCLPIIVDLIYDHVIEQDGGLCDGNANLIGPASRVLGEFCSGSESHTQHIIDIGGLDVLFLLTAFHLASVRKNAWFALSNISAGAPQQVRELLKRGVFSRACDILAHRDWSFKKISIGSQTSDSGSQDYDASFISREDIYIKEDVVWCLCNPFESDIMSNTTTQVMMEILDCPHGVLGEAIENDPKGMYGLVSMFEAVNVLISSNIKGGDRNKRLELAVKIMKVLELATGPILLSPKISSGLKKQGKKITAILQTCLMQHSTDLSRITESVCDQVLQRISEA